MIEDGSLETENNTTTSFQEQNKLLSTPVEKGDKEKTIAGDRSYKMSREAKRKSSDRCRERSGWCKDDKNRKRSCSRSPGRGQKDTKRRSSPQYSKHGGMSDSRRLSCRLFIGNLPKGTRKADLVEFFNRMLRKSGVCRGFADPVEDCYVIRDQFAFIQCRTVEETTMVLTFNGCNFKGNSLKIERPLGHRESAGMNKAQPFRGGVLINPWATTPDHTSRESRTLWIWNIPIGVLGEKVAEFFNNLMIISGFARGPGESVINCRVILGKEYYTLELRSVEEATRAMLLNGVSFMGSSLTITRPNEPRPVEGNAALRDTLRAAVLPVSARLDCIIYVTNITPGAKVDEMVKLFNQQMHLSGLAQTLGDPIVAYQFNPLKNIAFIEFRTAVEARGAVALNGIAYLGRNLIIGRINEFQQLVSNYGNETTPLTALGGERLTSCSVAPKESCRLYVGNIPPGHRDVSKLQEELKIFFNEQMNVAGLKLAPGAPVVGVQFQPNATYAFIEFRSLEETTQALSLDGISFHNRELKIKRPNNYKPPQEKGRNADHGHPKDLGEEDRHCSLSTLEKNSLGQHKVRFGEEELSSSITGGGELTLSSAAPKESCRLYVGNIPPGYKDISKLRDELKLFFNQEMNLAGLQLATGNPIVGVWVHPNSKYAFLEFRSVEETTKAMLLDGISYHNRMLQIKRPSNYKPPQGTKEAVSSRSDCPLHIPCNSRDNEFQTKEEAASALFLGGMNRSHRSPNYTISDFSSGAVRELSSGSAGRSDCKLCIGNFPYGIAEVELIEFFNKVMHQTGLSEGIGDAVISCKIVPDTNFAHIEFRSPSEATKALILDDISFRGEKMKIKRPFDSQTLDADVGFQNVRIQEDSPSVSGIHRLTNRNEMLPVNDNGLYPAQQKTKAVGFTPGNSQMSDPIPAIDSLISRSEVTTSQVLKHVADFQQRGYFGGTEFTAVANLLSVNISVCCANGTKMTYHPNAGPASATVEIQSPKMSSPPIAHGTNQGPGLQGLASSASWDISYPSVDVQIQGHQADNLKQSSSYPSSGSNTPPRCWESSYNSLLTAGAGVPLKALETTRTPTHGETNWLIATWNVRGANSVEKQCAIDEIMYSKAVAVAALQETYLPSSCFDTSHYKWLLSADSRQSSQSGVGFLVRRDLASMINRWTSISDYLACLHLRINGQSIAVVTVCIPSDDAIATTTLKNLLSIVSVLPSTSHIFVVGDFNAQIGSDDLKEISRTYIGHCLGHLHSNKNGVRLVNILRECRLYLLSSLFGNSSTIVTWSKGPRSAQVDHILGNCPSSVSQVAACFVPMVDTDHKLIWATSVLSCSKHSITVSDFPK